MLPASELIASARELLDIPWRHLGRTEQGLDCLGLPMLAGRRRGVLFPDRRRYGRAPAPDLLEGIRAACSPAPASLPPGALLLFKFPGERWPRHVALLTDCGTIIHAEARLRARVIEHGYRVHWVDWTHSAWLLPGIAYVGVQ